VNPRRENNKYDIVLEAENILEAYSRRCSLSTQSNLTVPKKRKRFIKFCLFFSLALATCIILLKTLF